MREGRARKIGVQKRYHYANAVQSQPDCDIFRAVSHHQTDHVAFLKVMLDCPTRITIGALYEITETIAFALGNQGRCVAVLGSDVIEFNREDAAWIVFDARRLLQSA